MINDKSGYFSSFVTACASHSAAKSPAEPTIQLVGILQRMISTDGGFRDVGPILSVTNNPNIVRTDYGYKS